VGRLTLPRLQELNKHWASFPPVHISMSRLCGAFLEKPVSKEDRPKTLEDFIGDFVAASGGGIAGV